MKVRSERAKERPELWFSRFKRWRQTWERLYRTERRVYRYMMNLQVPRYNLPEQTDVHWMARDRAWFLSRLSDATPEIRVSNDSAKDAEAPPMQRPGMAPPPPTAADMADFQEILVTRGLREANAPRELRSAVDDLCWAGFSVLWAGMPSFPNHAKVEAASEGAGDAVEQILTGHHEIMAGQDHETIVEAIRAVLDSPTTGVAMPSDKRMTLIGAMAAHQQAAIEEAENSHPTHDHDDRVFVRWSPPGWTYWDPLVMDVTHSRWMARKIALPLDVIHGADWLSPSARKTVKASRVYDEDWKDGRTINAEGMTPFEMDEENGMGVLVEVYDARFRSHHFLSESTSQYLEVDEENPYAREDGDPAVPGFIPASVCVPLKGMMDNPDRAFGTPLLAAGYPQAEAIVKMRSMMVLGAKKTNRILLIHPAVPQHTKAAITGGKDLYGVDAGEGVDIDKQVYPVPIPPVPNDWEKETNILERDHFNAIGITPSAVTGETQGGTATESANIESASQATLDDIKAQVADFYGRIAEVVRSLMRFYTPEHVASLVGAKYKDVFEAWKGTDSEGDRIEVRLGSDVDPVRVEQILKGIETAQTVVDPLMGVPLVPPRTLKRLVRELFRSLRLGDLDEYTPEEMEQIMAQAQAAQAPPGAGPKGQEKGGNPPSRGAPPSRGQVEGKARATPPVAHSNPR